MEDKRRKPHSISELTPRSLIKGLLQHTEVEEPHPSKRPRLNPPDDTPPLPQTTLQRTITPRTLPRSAARRQVTRHNALMTTGDDLTPRTLIRGLVGAAPVETPAVHLRRSTPHQSVNFPQVEDIVQGSAISATMSPFIGELDPTINQSQPLRSTLRKRQPISSEEFAAGVREKLSQRQDDRSSEQVGDDGGDVEERNISEDDVEGDSDRDKDERQLEYEEDNGDLSEKAGDIPEEAGDVSEEAGDVSEEVGDVLEEAGDVTDARNIPEEAGNASGEAGDVLEEDGDVNEETGDVTEETGDVTEEPGEHKENHDKEPESAMSSASSSTPSSRATSIQTSANKQAADSTWMGRESEASIPNQRDGSPSLMRRVPDSTVGDSASEGEVIASDDQPMDSETLGGSEEEQQTVAMAQSRVGDFSPLVTPRLPAGTGRPTPSLKKTPAPARQQAVEREQASTSAAPKQGPSKPSAPRKDAPCLPTSLTKSILSHFSKARLSKEAVAAAEKGAEAFFKRLSNDLTAYSHHGHRQTIEQSDIELLMRRQGLMQDQQSLYALIEKYLPMEYRKELIPMATAGNKVTPRPNH